MSLFKWSTTAASNDTIDSTINWRENQAPSTVNDAARSMMAAIAKWRDDLSGNLVTAGTATAITLTSSQGFTALTDGISVVARMTTTNGVNPTLNVDSLGAKAIAGLFGTAIPTGALLAGTIHKFTYDATDDKWIVHGGRGDTYSAGGTDVAVADGGTGASTAADARTNLGVTATGADTAYNFRANNLSDVANAATAFTNIKQAASDSATGVLEIAVQSEMEAGSSATLAVTPGRQHFHPGHVKAGGNFDGTGTPAFRSGDYGMGGITDNGTGDYTLALDTAFADTNYWCTAWCRSNAATPNTLGVSAGSAGTKTTSALQVFTGLTSGSSGQANDSSEVGISLWGDYA